MELTRNRVKSKTAKKRILFVEKVKTRESRDQYHLIPIWFFSVGLDNTVRIRDKLQVVYQEMARDEYRSNVAKWNLSGKVKLERWRNVHVVQWLGMFWLDFRRFFHSTWWNVSC